MIIEVVKHFKRDTDGVHLLSVSCNGKNFPLEHSRFLRSTLAEHFECRPEELAIHQVGESFE